VRATTTTEKKVGKKVKGGRGSGVLIRALGSGREREEGGGGRKTRSEIRRGLSKLRGCGQVDGGGITKKKEPYTDRSSRETGLLKTPLHGTT